jgi:hypothetical protein
VKYFTPFFIQKSMEALLKLLNRFNYLTPKYLWMRVFSDKELQRWIIDVLVQDEQLQKGIDGTGERITDNEGNNSYSYWTEILSQGKKQEGNPYTLKDTGEFYESMVFLLGDRFFEIDANPNKTNDSGKNTNLFDKYGEEIVGLTEESLEKLRDKLQEKLVIEIQQILQGN